MNLAGDGYPEKWWWGIQNENLVRRLLYRNAVWESSLSTKAKLVALAYEKYAGKGTEKVWVAGDNLRRITHMSRDTANKALRELEHGGWLTVEEAAAQHRSTRYRLTVPSTAPDVAKAWTLGMRPKAASPSGSVPIPRRQRSDSEGSAFRRSETNSNTNSDLNEKTDSPSAASPSDGRSQRRETDIDPSVIADLALIALEGSDEESETDGPNLKGSVESVLRAMRDREFG